MLLLKMYYLPNHKKYIWTKKVCVNIWKKLYVSYVNNTEKENNPKADYDNYQVAPEKSKWYLIGKYIFPIWISKKLSSH